MAFVPGVHPARRIVDPAHVYAFTEGGLVVRDGGVAGLPLSLADALALGIAADDLHVIGTDGDVAVVAAAVPRDTRLPGAQGFTEVGLREVFVRFGEEAFSVVSRASQIALWSSTHRYCGRCGSPTAWAESERAAVCNACKLRAFPRIAPAIIVLVRKGDTALLARNARFPPNRYSTLAGFSEPGESLEETLRREVREEVGVEVEAATYFGSQPWPFPNSLMIGFTARWASGEVTVDGDEIVDARFFAPTELPQLPPRMSIARRLVDAWLDEVGRARDP